MKKVLIACEESQTICTAFRELGHEAYSCDLLETSGNHPEWHYIKILHDFSFYKEFDLIIAHPPCTYLTVSNNAAMKNGCSKYSADEAKWRRYDAIEFFRGFVQIAVEFPKIKLCIENPIGIMSKEFRKPKPPHGQIIQPWMFGHGETKATCLWLFNLPPLQPTNIVSERESRIHKMSPGKERSKLRSKTYPGIAKAMAEQWGKLL